MADWTSQRMANTQRRALESVRLLQPWVLPPQPGLDVFGNPLPYVDPSGTDVVAQELNRLLAPVPAVAAALGWGAEQQAQQQMAGQAQGQPAPTQPQPPTVPQFVAPPQLQGLPLPPPPKMPEPPKSLADTLAPYPNMPEFQPPQREWIDVAAQVITGLVAPEALPFVTQAFEKAHQERVAEARDRYERAAANALGAWQAKRQLELADVESQRDYQRQLSQLQNQYQQAQYQTQLARLQQENEQAQREWQARQQYGQWQYEQQWRAYDKEEQRRILEEQKRYDRELRQELQRNQMGLSMYNSLMGYTQKPTLTASERQTALASIPALKSVLPQEFHPYLDALGRNIHTKPSVPEQRLDIERQRAAAAIQQGWERLRIAQQRLALARLRATQGDSQGAWAILKVVNSKVEQMRDNIRQIDTALGRQVQDPLTLQPRPAILGEERDRLTAQRNKMEQDLQQLLNRRDALESQLLFGGAKSQPAREMEVNGKKVTVTVK